MPAKSALHDRSFAAWFAIAGLTVMVGATSGCISAALNNVADDLDDFEECSEPPPFSGTLATSAGELSFETVEPFLEASRDEGCVNQALIDFARGPSEACQLEISTTPLDDGAGLLIDGVTLRVNDTDCPSWGLDSGTFRADRSDAALGTVSFDGEVKGNTFPCFRGTTTVSLTGFTATTADGTPLEIQPSTLVIEDHAQVFENTSGCPTA